MNTKKIFDKNYEYYRNILNKPSIPLEAMQLIFDCMEEYSQLPTGEMEEGNNSAKRIISKYKTEDDYIVAHIQHFYNEEEGIGDDTSVKLSAFYQKCLKLSKLPPPNNQVDALIEKYQATYGDKLIDILWEVKDGKTHPNKAYKQFIQDLKQIKR